MTNQVLFSMLTLSLLYYSNIDKTKARSVKYDKIRLKC
jgi:hypothetical protein